MEAGQKDSGHADFFDRMQATNFLDKNEELADK